MADQGGDLSFFQGIHVRIDTEIDISISIRPMTARFGKQVLLEELTPIRVIKQVLMTSSCYRSRDKLKTYSHYHSAHGKQKWQDDNLS